MLSEVEKKEIEKEFHHYEKKQAVCIEALKVVQKQRGWVTDEGINDVASFLEMTPDEVDSVATFYNLIYRKPVGRNVILICDSVSCWVMGYSRLREHLKKKLGIQPGETTKDGRFTLLPIACLGTCDHAPALMINDDLHRDVSPESIESILALYK